MSSPIAWRSWLEDPIAEQTGVSFDRTPAASIRAPASKVRVCAYHIDFDERPTAYVDLDSLAEAEHLCANLSQLCGSFNVDYAIAYDARGKVVVNGRPW